MSNVYMFGAFVLDRVLSHVHSTDIVTSDGNAPNLDAKVFNLLFYPWELSTIGGSTIQLQH